jgi:hypothetical protein
MGKNCSPLKKAIGEVVKYFSTKNLTRVLWTGADGTRIKPMQFDITKITDSLIYDALIGNKADALHRLTKIISPANPETYKKLHANLMATGEKNLALLGVNESFDENDDNVNFDRGGMIKLRSIAIHEILSALESEPNVQRNAGILDEDAGVLFNNDGSRNLNLLPIRQVIGQKILAHMDGDSFKTKGDQVYAADMQAKLGQAVIDSLVADGIINYAESGTVINPSYVEDTTSNDDSGAHLKKGDQFAHNFEVVSLNLNKFLNKKDDGNKDKAIELQKLLEEGKIKEVEDLSSVAYETIQGVNAVSRMVVPTNEKSPVYGDENIAPVKAKGLGQKGHKDFSEVDTSHRKEFNKKVEFLKQLDKNIDGLSNKKKKTKEEKELLTKMKISRTETRESIQEIRRKYGGIGITQEHKELMNKLSDKEASLNSFANNLMIEFSNELLKVEDRIGVDPEITLRNALSNLDFTKTSEQNMIFGLFGGSTTDDFKSKIGQSISKTNPLLQLAMNFQNFIDEKGDSVSFKHELEIYRTTRMGYMATFLNEQMDKNLARALTESAYAVEFDMKSEMFTDMVQTIQDQGLDVTSKEMSEHGYHRGLDFAVDFIQKNRDKNGKLSAKSAAKLLKWAMTGSFGPKGLKVPTSGSGPFTTVSLLTAVADIRDANGGKIKTKFRTKFDASGSGIMLTAYQSIGKYEGKSGDLSVYQMLENMGYIQGKEFGSELEFNKRLENDEEGLIKDVYHILLNGLRKAKDDNPQAAEAYEMMEKLAELKIFKNIRDLVKPMTMITNYQAGEYTAVKGTAAELRATVTEHLLNDATPESLAYIKSMIKTADEDGEFYKENKIDGLSTYKLANVEGINAKIEKFFADGLAKSMREEIESSMLPMFSDYKSDIKGIFGLMDLAFRAKNNKDPKDDMVFGILPAIARLTMDMKDKKPYDDFKKNRPKRGSDDWKSFMKHHRKMLRKYSMPLTSKRQMVVHKDGKPWTVVMAEEPNGLTPSVNAIHSIDAAIFFISHKDTIEELQKIVDDKSHPDNALAEIALKNASGMIHDANNADPFYNSTYKAKYRENSIRVNENYDIQEELALTYASMEGTTKHYSPDESDDALDKAQKGIEKKKTALADVSTETYRHFGFMSKEDFETTEKPKVDALVKYDENTEPSAEEMVKKPIKEDGGTNTSDDSLLYDITKSIAKKAYMTMRNALKNKKPMVIFDVETNGNVDGKPAPGKSKVNPSEVHEIAITKVNHDGDNETQTFYFDVNDISDGARKVVFPDTADEYEAVDIMQERFAKQGLDTNEDVMKAIEDFVGKDAMFAYNAGFDYKSLDIMQKKYGGNLDLSERKSKENDIFAATMWIKSKEGTEELSKGKGENTLKSTYAQFAEGKETWNDNKAHGAEYDTERTADMVESFRDGINSGKLKSKSKNQQHSGKKRSKSEVDSLVNKWKNEDSDLGRFLQKFGDIVVGEESTYDALTDLIELTNDGSLTESELKQELEHEISHQKTTGFFGANKDDVDVAYLEKNIPNIKKMRDALLKAISDPIIKDRLEKFLAEPNDTVAALEFIAIMDAEPEARGALLKAAENPAITARIGRLLRKLANWFKSSTEADFNVKNMIKSVDEIVKKGENFNRKKDSAQTGRRKASTEIGGSKLNARAKMTPAKAQANFDKKNKIDYHKTFKTQNTKNSAAKDIPGFYQWNILNNQSGELVQNILYNLEPYSDSAISNADRWLEDNFDIYKVNKLKLESIWEGNDAVQSIKGYMNRPRLGREDLIQFFESIQMNAEQDAKSFRDTQIVEMNKLIEAAELDGKPLTDADISALTEVSARSAIFHLANNGKDIDRVINADDTMKEIDDMIDEITSNITAIDHVNSAEQIGMVLAGKLSGSNAKYYNVEQMRIAKPEDKRDIQRLVALYALKHNDSTIDGIKIMNQNEDLKKTLVATAIALEQLTLSVLDGSSDKLSFKESMAHDYFEKQKEIIAINQNDLNIGRYPASAGWRIVRAPKGNDYGIATRDGSKATRQSGAGTTENYSLYDIMVPQEIFNKDAKNAISIKTNKGSKLSFHKLSLTADELATFDDYVSNPADILIRSHAQMMVVKDTQSVRDYIMYRDVIDVQKSKEDAIDFDKKLKTMKKEDRPWMISVPKGMTMEEYFKQNPRAKIYYKAPDYASSVNGFNKSFDLVRKDIHDMLLGYSDVELFENNATGKNIMFAIRQTVLLVKGHWISMNPGKIAADIVSNNVILSLKGVPYKDMAVNQGKSIKLSKEMSDLRSELIAVEFEYLKAKHYGKSDISTLEAKRDKLVKKIEGHEFAPLYKNGMLQSMSTEILKKDEAVVTGLQHNVENVFNLVLKNGEGDPSTIAKGVQWFADAGWSVDQLAVWLGKSAENVDMFDGFVKNVGKNMKESGKRVQQKKKDEDMAKYLSEFLGSPDSELSRIGSYVVHMSDIAARYTLYKHLKNNPMKYDAKSGKKAKLTDAQIVTEVLDSFVDYKVNMPKELKFVSDHGILLFPSFWLRIQKVMYVLAKEAPAKLGTGMLMHEALGISVASYYDSNIISKIGDIVNVPPSITDPLDVFVPVDFLEDITFWM